ncbi:hypothetical protein AB1Y20_014459 [Prymnesium parvum]|uniref:Uncharacterized protein n=1 Tax=Prymnesium parvum TaxID=97485 RepID=A0AB34IF15_PRYPA
MAAMARGGSRRAAAPDEVRTGASRPLDATLLAARRTGHLNLRGRGLRALPRGALCLSEIPLPESIKWWELREALEVLDASENELEELPHQIASQVELREVALSHNKLTSLPPHDCWRELSCLVSLVLSHNEIRALPDGLGNLPPLARLDVSHNQLDSLPGSITEMCRLAVLDVSHNRLASLPDGLAALAALRQLHASHNRLASLPAATEAPSLPSLEHATLNDNLLPRLRLASPALQSLQVAKNRLASLELEGCVALRELAASHNLLAELPPSLARLPALATLDVGANRIRAFPAAVVRACVSLTRLDASCNELSSLPAELGLLALTKLTLHGNPLRTLPSSVLNGPTPKLLEHLRSKLELPAVDALAVEEVATSVVRSGADLNLVGQRLRALPEKLCEQEALITLDLSRNEISDLTNEIGWLQALRKLRASQNSLRHLPPSLCEISTLAELQVDQNLLTELPPALWSCPSLTFVSFNRNRLTVPALGLPEGRALAPVRHLDLGENRLGATPPLACLPQLHELHLQGNSIRELRVALLPLGALVTLDLRDNDIAVLPPELSAAAALQSLGLSGNPLRSMPHAVQAKGARAVLELLAKRMAN